VVRVLGKMSGRNGLEVWGIQGRESNDPSTPKDELAHTRRAARMAISDDVWIGPSCDIANRGSFDLTQHSNVLAGT
jgi:hypothetical protein